MTYDLYNGGADISKQRETAYQEQQATEIKLHAIRQLIEAVKLTWDLFITARDQLPMLSMHVIASEKTVRAYAEQYQIGQRTLLDLLDSQNELFSAKRSYVNGRFDMYTSRYRLLRDTGIQIVMPIPTQQMMWICTRRPICWINRIMGYPSRRRMVTALPGAI
jgi:adhesin transport system outer membrane protein